MIVTLPGLGCWCAEDLWLLAHATIDRIYRPLRARAYELTRSDADADDLTHETLVQLLERPPSRSGTDRETLHYARLRMGRIFVRDVLGVPRSPAARSLEVVGAS